MTTDPIDAVNSVISVLPHTVDPQVRQLAHTFCENALSDPTGLEVDRVASAIQNVAEGEIEALRRNRIAYTYEDDDGVQQLVYDDEALAAREIRQYKMRPYNPAASAVEALDLPEPRVSCRACGLPISGRFCRECARERCE